ncbi:YitT family protein [Olsenella uli]|uniref:YitT family protein n=1 Tax=Olsenella uli TaxID=133926 RepID=UPI00195E13D3|nr:YitT family protein [Olsenella uli]MBM6817146.1 YitT family protein [Olsenella uli]
MSHKLLNVLAIALGNLLVALAVTLFIVPHGLVLGGSTGMALVITHLAPLPLSLVVLAINGALFLLGALFLGRRFAASTIFSTIAYPLAMSVLETLPLGQLTSDHMLAAVCAGTLMGAGTGLILRAGGSSGGSDVIALVAHRYLHANVSALLWAIDACVIACQLPFSNFEQVLLGVLALTLLTLVMNRVMVMGRSQVQLLIFSSEHEAIRQNILSEQDAGVTVIPIEQGYTRQEGKAILSVIPRRKLWRMREMITAVDPAAFWVISEVSEMRERQLRRRA